LSRANLSRADLTDADLTRANLTDANLSRANLSRAKGLLDPSEYLAEKFEATDEGILCYKSFESNYAPPPDWNIEPHAVITEICNPCRTTACASGVNVATLEWAQRNNRCREIWKCLIRWIDLAGVVVPYNTDGKIRASRVELIEVVR
ncbi:MAG: pentapeptide repeat-containing protein, partial [Sphaerochaeta sp.]|nr:pentapeptide repeat-containing protein [Sphaerochaeta sp.]